MGFSQFGNMQFVIAELSAVGRGDKNGLLEEPNMVVAAGGLLGRKDIVLVRACKEALFRVPLFLSTH